MNYSIVDLAGVIGATVACGVLLLLPGLALAHIADVLGFRKTRTQRIYAVALVTGCAVLPVLDSLLARFLGLGAALAFNLALVAYGLRVLRRVGVPRPDRFVLAACGAWMAVLLYAWIDFGTGERLYPSLLMLDIVKHAATARALVETGFAPPIDPFFLRDDPAGYYYFYYLLSALAERLGGGWIDSRTAVAGQVFWTGVATLGLLTLILEKAGQAGRIRPPVILALMCAAGLQILPVIMAGFSSHLWLGQMGWWSDQVASWPMSLLWVPHHVAGVIACWFGFLLLAEIAERRTVDRSKQATAILLAALAFASSAGLSIWVTLGAVATMLLWTGLLTLERRWNALLAVAVAGLMSAAIAAPDLVDLVRYRGYGSAAPVALTVRAFPFTDVLFADGIARYAARLATLPLNYLIEFGVFLVGAWLYWRRRPSEREFGGETGRLLVLSALAGLVLATFLKSTIINNDLGWRVILFAQLSALLWTKAVLCSPSMQAALPRGATAAARAVLVTGIVGGLGVAYDLIALRAYQPLGLTGEEGLRRDPVIDREVRAAYTWLTANADRSFVVQHNPDAKRAFGYGLYGRSRVAVSDRDNSRLFGAPQAGIAGRLAEIIPAFATPMAADKALRRFARNRIDIAVVTSTDPAWHDKASWVWTLPSLYATAHVRVLSVRPNPGAVVAGRS
jgi:hypothetical protein